ncbi:CD225/dispanin family protein [Ascidiimonas sp. W6]|uniref:CD225/dispanin family protein n=1 Tax=Ascidiimonas meishanensis TaxID=3128903 RepID=UPI0030EDF91A
MKKYFYTDGTDKFGPFTLGELKEKNISRETLIWFEGLGDWKPASGVPELDELFVLSPPPVVSANSISSTEGNVNNQKPPKTWLLESILVTLFCCLPFGIAGIVNAAKVESRFYAGDIEGANRSSRDAKKWTSVSFWLGLAIGVIYLILAIIGTVSGF